MSTHTRNKPVWKTAVWGVLALSLTACNGGGGGGGGSEPVPLVDGGFIKTVAEAFLESNSFPFSDSHDIKTQHLYYADEVNGAGNIAVLRLKRQFATVAPISCPDFTVRLGHTNVTTLGTTFAGNVEQGQGSLVTTVDNLVFEIPAGAAGEWIDIPLSSPFHYNGVDNLVVEFETASTCSLNQTVSVDWIAGRRAYSSALDATPGVVDHNPDTALGVDNKHYHMQFDFNGGDNSVVTAGDTGTITPFSPGYPKAQMLYTPAEIDGSGPVTGIAFRMFNDTVAADYTYSVRLGHNSMDALSPTFADNFNVDGSTLVADEANWTLPDGIPAGEWVWLPVPDGVFTYNGTDNLVVEVVVSAATAQNAEAYFNGAYGGVVWADSAAATTGTVTYAHVDAKLRFNGGTMDVISSGANSSNYPFSSLNTNKTQVLYTADTLGTAGEITSVGCRLASAGPTLETSYGDIEVTLGHTTRATLTNTYANNMDDATLVRDGSFTVPAGLVQGDWIEIPLTTPFAYDGERNLVVQTASRELGPTTYQCTVGYANKGYYMTWNDADAVTATPQVYRTDLRLGYRRY